MTLAHRLLAVGVLIAAVVLIDLAPGGEPAGDGPAADEPAGGRAAPERVFAVLVDSLRFDVAVDPTISPTLVRLGRDALWGRTVPCRDNVTTECLRAAFGGRDPSTALTGIAGLRGRRADHMLLPRRMHARGQRSWYCGDDTGQILFSGTADDCRRRTPVAESDEQRTRAALDAWRSGRYALVLLHLVDADRASHHSRVGTPPYRRAFSAADALCERVSAAVGARDTLWIFGDHGHDERGRHLYGVGSDTFHLYRGPAFRPGRRDLAMVDHRLLLGALLGDPPLPGYQGTRDLGALAPGLLAARPGLQEAVQSLPPTPAVRWAPRLSGLWACALAVAALAVVEAGGRRRRAAAAASLALAASFALGAVSSQVRELVHGRSLAVDYGLFALIGVAGWLLARPRTATRVATTVLVLAFLVLYPTVLSYGALRATTLAIGLAWLALRRAAPSWTAADLARDAFLAAALLSFQALYCVNLRIVTFEAYQAVMRAGMALPALAAAQACAFLPLARGGGVPAALAGAAAGTAGVLWGGRLPPAAGAAAFAIGAILAGAAAFRPRSRAAAVAGLAGAEVALGVAFAGDLGRLLPTCVLFGVSALLAWQATRGGTPPSDGRAALAGLCLAWLAALSLWPTMGGRFSDADWGFLLAWMDVRDADRQRALVGALLAVKYLLPACAIVLLGKALLGGWRAAALRAGFRLVAARAASLAAMAAGVAAVAWPSGIYRETLEAALSTAALAALLALLATDPPGNLAARGAGSGEAQPLVVGAAGASPAQGLPGRFSGSVPVP